ncbi:hypothetical protein PL326_02615 [Clostridium perfringens D]|nr:hypothetical protein [Clostridium perfringens]WEV13591.1 hypothetical protein PL326_02615 [Clostridium perfringens D]
MKNNNTKKWITLLVLCAGGGIIYRLPYLREVFLYTNATSLSFNKFSNGFFNKYVWNS